MIFRVRPFETKTLTWWRDEREEIDLSPVYQRKGGVWSDPDKQFLIDSILNEFDIPKVYIADFTYINTPLNENRKKYAIVDGRQRFEAIYEFFENKIVLAKDFEYIQQPNLLLGGLSYRDLQRNYPKIASKFDNFNLSVMSVITDDAARINDLFVRLNASKPLTGSELRNAMQGAVPGLIRSLVIHKFFQTCIKFAIKRMQDHNTAAKLLLVEQRGRLIDTKKINIDRLVVDESIRAETQDIQAATERVRDVLDVMANIFTHRDSLLSSQGPVTIYYWLVRDCMKNPAIDIGRIRPFLVAFNSELNVNKLRKNDDPKLDAQLRSYEVVARSVNDAGSLSYRYLTLRRRFYRELGLETADQQGGGEG